MQSLGRDSSRLRGEVIDGCEGATREQVSADAGKRHDEWQTENEDNQDL